MIPPPHVTFVLIPLIILEHGVATVDHGDHPPFIVIIPFIALDKSILMRKIVTKQIVITVVLLIIIVLC